MHSIVLDLFPPYSLSSSIVTYVSISGTFILTLCQKICIWKFLENYLRILCLFFMSFCDCLTKHFHFPSCADNCNCPRKDSSRCFFPPHSLSASIVTYVSISFALFSRSSQSIVCSKSVSSSSILPFHSVYLQLLLSPFR